jgi:hypothetical protein
MAKPKSPYGGMAYGSPEFKKAAAREMAARNAVSPKQAPIAPNRTAMSMGFTGPLEKTVSEYKRLKTAGDTEQAGAVGRMIKKYVASGGK